jgi:hypothetical protein
LGLLTAHNANRRAGSKKKHSRVKSNNYLGKDYDYSGYGHQRSKEVDYDLNINYKDPQYSHKTSGTRVSGTRKKRDHNKSKENYYQALETMLSKAQNQGNLTDK